MPACGGKDDSDDDAGTGASMTGTGTMPGTMTGGGTADLTTGSSMEAGTTHETGHMSEETADPTGAELSCDAYCASIATNCTGANTQYGMLDFCMASCESFPVGAATDTSGNTLGCRTYHAGAAAGDPAVHCVHAGPGGAGVCGGQLRRVLQRGDGGVPRRVAGAVGVHHGVRRVHGHGALRRVGCGREHPGLSPVPRDGGRVPAGPPLLAHQGGFAALSGLAAR
jgi:hypothetical protein